MIKLGKICSGLSALCIFACYIGAMLSVKHPNMFTVTEALVMIGVAIVLALTSLGLFYLTGE